MTVMGELPTQISTDEDGKPMAGILARYLIYAS